MAYYITKENEILKFQLKKDGILLLEPNLFIHDKFINNSKLFATKEGAKRYINNISNSYEI